MFQDLYEEDRLTDVTLVCEDQTQFKAHKIVLSACSPVFKKIIDNNPSQHPLIYLMGIQNHEMESILQFMYLGEGKFYYERMGEFLKVAKDLEVKGISNISEKSHEEEDVIETNAIVDEEVEVKSEGQGQNVERNLCNQISTDYNSIECPECPEVFATKTYLMTHLKSVHEGFSFEDADDNNMVEIKNEEEDVIEKTAMNEGTAEDYEQKETSENRTRKSIKYACNQCDYQNFQKSNLTKHIQVKHKGIRYPCMHCDHQATSNDSLQKHIQSRHGVIKYPCDQCDYQVARQDSLQRHIQSKHEGIKYPCNHCDYQATQQSNLKAHIAAKHIGNILKCELCGYRTKWKKSYDAHKNAHCH